MIRERTRRWFLLYHARLAAAPGGAPLLAACGLGGGGSRAGGDLQVAGGAGSPGPRDDVWSDLRLGQISHVYGLIQRTYKTPGPTHLPWNETYFELTTLATKLDDLRDGKAGLRDAVQTIVREAAPILEKPPA